MRFRWSRERIGTDAGLHLRSKITALLLSLALLWAFAAWVTGRDGLNLLWLGTLDQKVTRPMATLLTDLQDERRMSAEPQISTTDLAAQRARTDAAVKSFRDLSTSELAKLAAGSAVNQNVRALLAALDSLSGIRAGVDAQPASLAAVLQPYDNIIDAIFKIYGAAGTIDDQGIAKDARSLIALTRAKEILSREDALLTGIIAAGRMTPSDHVWFIQLVGTQRFMHAEAATQLSTSNRADYDKVVADPDFQRMQALEERVVQFQSKKPNAVPPVTEAEWQSASAPVLRALEKVELTGGDRAVSDSTPVAIGVVIRLILAGGLGLVALIASIVLAITTARRLVRQIERLRAAAYDLADRRLPGVVERLGHGEEVDVAAEAPPLAFGDDQIGQLGKAFNRVQETAVRTAVEQAELRRSIRDILLSLARRSQALVHRQLSLLDVMERREMDTTELEDLFRVDHLATRMRRNAENLIILSGATPARGWRRPVPMMDVVRSAVAEVEDYTRVTVMPMGDVALAGRAVGDIAHLLAELIENAVSFSPPYTVAQVSGHMAANGFAVEVEDRGLGMTDEALEAINERIADPPEFNLSSSVQLGLYVVGRLAERYGIRVSVKHSPYGGTTAVVLIPLELISDLDPVEAGPVEQEDEAVPVVVGLPVRAVEASAGIAPSAIGGPPQAGQPAPQVADETEDPDTSLPSHTPSGLPLRVPQASLAPPLREETDAEPEQAAQPDPGRSPDEIRRIVGAFQTGTRRGRAAAQSQDPESEGNQ